MERDGEPKKQRDEKREMERKINWKEREKDGRGREIKIRELTWRKKSKWGQSLGDREEI